MDSERRETLDFDQYHREELPRLIAAGHGELAAGEARRRGSLAFRITGGGAYTYAVGPRGIESGALEVTTRRGLVKEEVPFGEAATDVIEKVKSGRAGISG